tara:strand:- start:671 stop:1078 length:408 start_codon:yes stop_codon:yes gene_type:complete
MINVYPIINLYKQFDKYKDNSDDEILSHIYPSLELNQYKIHKENGRIYGFSNWAFLSKEEEDYLLEKNRVYQEAWNSGDIVWHMDIVAKNNVKQIMEWTKQHFTQLLGFNQRVKWLRIHNDKIIPKEILTKRHFV